MGTGKFNAGLTLRWTGIPSRRSRNTPSRFMPQKSEISAGLMGHLAGIQILLLPCFFYLCHAQQITLQLLEDR